MEDNRTYRAITFGCKAGLMLGMRGRLEITLSEKYDILYVNSDDTMVSFVARDEESRNLIVVTSTYQFPDMGAQLGY